MKYIRTKDGIYQFENNENICKKDNELFEIQRFFQPVDHINYKLLGKIKAKADTIEELCDCFLLEVENKETKEKLYYIYDELDTLRSMKPSTNWKGNKYGVIGTSKGLIYVAKMNEKGDLELI